MDVLRCLRMRISIVNGDDSDNDDDGDVDDDDDDDDHDDLRVHSMKS